MYVKPTYVCLNLSAERRETQMSMGFKKHSLSLVPSLHCLLFHYVEKKLAVETGLPIIHPSITMFLKANLSVFCAASTCLCRCIMHAPTEGFGSTVHLNRHSTNKYR